MKNFYLIGENINNSLSPYIHNWIYRFLNIEATYSIKDIGHKELTKNKIQNIFNDIYNNKINGINITTPYKSEIISEMINLSEDAKKINAINCIYKYIDKLIGDNTDWFGFLESLKYYEINLDDYNIIIIGSGGASKSIVYSLQINNYNNFQIYNRSKKDFLLINKHRHEVFSLEDLEKNIIPKTLIINCTPRNSIDTILTKKILKNVVLFYDLNYVESIFYSRLNDEDIQVISGLDMLIYQAIKSIELWLNKEIKSQINIDNIKEYLKEFIDVN